MKVVSMFNALPDTDKTLVLAGLVMPEQPAPEPDDPGFPPPPAEPLIPETPYEVPNPSFAERYEQ